MRNLRVVFDSPYRYFVSYYLNTYPKTFPKLMYIYITQKCQENAEKYYIIPKITELYDNSEVLDLFDPIYPYWKRRIGKYRLLAKIEEVDNEKILCLLNILERKSQEYEEFTDKNKRQKFGQDKLESLLNDDEIKEWLNEQKESVCQEQNKREPLPNDLLVGSVSLLQ